jgi:hypothetical protein
VISAVAYIVLDQLCLDSLPAWQRKKLVPRFPFWQDFDAVLVCTCFLTDSGK